jgi:hypothetical protein
LFLCFFVSFFLSFSLSFFLFLYVSFLCRSTPLLYYTMPAACLPPACVAGNCIELMWRRRMMAKNNGGINEDILQRLRYKHTEWEINEQRINKCKNWLL